MMMATEIPEYPPVYQLKITMAGIRPLIWRRILVSGDVKLYKPQNPAGRDGLGELSSASFHRR
jgi:hypothetical protein